MSPLRRLAASGPEVALVLTILILASPASAQSRFELGAGVTWTGGFDAGGGDALLTRNPATGSTPLTLFETSSRVKAAPGASIIVGLRLTSRVAVEAMADYSRPVLRTTISNDFENATGTTADSRLTSLVVGGSALYTFGSARLIPFAFGGAGWMRQLDEDNVMLLTGAEAHGGGGVKYRLDRHFALRGQGGVTIRQKSIAFDERRRLQPQTWAGLTYHW